MPRLNRSLCCAAVLGALSLCGAAEQARPAETFADGALSGPAVALAVDEAGRVFLALSGRSFGRGVYDVSEREALAKQDRTVMTLEDRQRVTEEWIRAGHFKPAPQDAVESVICLTDTDGDAKADTRTQVVPPWGGLLDGPAGGLALLADSVFFACTPALWKFPAVPAAQPPAAPPAALVQGLGIRTGAGWPGCRAVTCGPDGRVYFTVGDRGAAAVSGDGTLISLEATGGVFRCEADGTGLELLARGLRDPAGIVVDERGRVFVADVAAGGSATRLLYVVPGADFGWNAVSQADGARGPMVLPACGVLEGRASGMCLQPHQDSASDLPLLVLADSSGRGGLTSISLTAMDSGFRAAAAGTLWSGGAVAGVAAGPDGALYWADWGRSMREGGTARLLRLPGPESGPWKDGQVLLQRAAGSFTGGELTALLEHGNPAVRRRARDLLVARGFHEALEPLSRTARRAPAVPARLNALWGLAALAARHPVLLNEIQLLFTSTEPAVRTLAVRLAGELDYRGPVQDVLQLLRDPSPAVRLEAAVAAGRLRAAGAEKQLLDAAAACGDSDPFWRQAIVWALSRTVAPAAAARMGLSDPRPAVRAALLQSVILRQAPETADFLEARDPAIVHAAAAAVYDGMIHPGYPALAALLPRLIAEPELRSLETGRRALAAACWLGGESEAAAVAAIAALPAEANAPVLKDFALQLLRQWDAPPPGDPVHGRHDDALPRPFGMARPFLVSLDPAAPATIESLTSLVASREKPEGERIDALRQLGSLNADKALEVARGLMPGNGTAALRAAARTLIMRYDAAASYTQIAEAMAAGSPQEKQTVLQLASRFDSKQGEALWLDLAKRHLEGTLETEIRLEVYEGLQMRDVSPRGRIRRILEAADAALNEEEDPLARWRMSETGGDPDKGRTLYETGRLVCCHSCHSVRGRGGFTGPALDGVASRLSRSQLLEALVQPSASIATGHGEVTVTMDDGRTHTGQLRRRDDSVLELSAGGALLRLNAAAVQSMTTPVSPMPSAAALLTPREIRDLTAWLATLK